MLPSVGKHLHAISRAAARLARRRRVAVLVVGLTSLCISATASVIRWPVPKVHDEFSYLLMADTFAEGRLANPTHPAWESLESFHIIHQPTYASKYPIGQGLVLSFGQVVFAHPIVGVWISTALAGAGICWMLQGWISPRWAFWGSLLFTFHGGIQILWGQSYWGGSVALAGGALLLGAAVRLQKQITLRHSVCLAAGLAILANSRPFEGLLVSLFVAVWLFGTWLKRRELLRVDLVTKVVVPVCICLAVTGTAMAYYNYRVTGRLLKMPYQVHNETYALASVFAWNEVGELPEYRHEVIRDFYLGCLREKRGQQITLIDKIRSKSNLVWFYATPAVFIPMLMIPVLIRRRENWFPLAVLVFVCVSTLTTYACHPHYYAAAAPLLILLSVQGFRHLAVLARRQRGVFRRIVPAVVVLQLTSFFGIAYGYAARPATFAEDRVRFEKQLEQTDGQHLVFVSYAKDHNVHNEWVYNRANIDSAKVVWAREMDAAGNLKTLAGFTNRKVWLLEADRLPRKLVSMENDTANSTFNDVGE